MTRPTLAARLSRLKPAPILDADILAALTTQADLPDDVAALARELETEAEAVGKVRELLADAPPVVNATQGSMLL